MSHRFLVAGVCLLASVSLSAARIAPSAFFGPLVVAQASTVTVGGTVFDASLNPVAGALVALEQNGRVIAKATTDATGAYHLTGVAPGDYVVRATHAGLGETTRDLHVPNGATSMQLPFVLSSVSPEATSESKIADTRNQAAKAPSSVPPSGNSSTVPMPVTTPPPPNAGPVEAPRVVGGVAAGGGAPAGRAGAMPRTAPIPRDYWPSQDTWPREPQPGDGESYAHLDANHFQSARDNPLSTFGADVDTASYTNVRRFLSAGQLPPRDAVRIEELVNYFHFDYAAPRDGRPIALTTEIGDCPWAPGHKLVLIGARAKAPTPREIAGRNLVLLIDVSGSMAPPERLPLIKTALGMFVDTLRPDDRLAIVTYAGQSGVALPSTPARQRDVIQRAIAGLNANGSTNGSAGLITAYRVASQNYIPGGVNRVILATDGDFNVGVVNQAELARLIERERTSGVFLSVFGVGSGNLRDSTMEMLADRGNGHYAYLDSLQEARRVLVREGDATLENVAKDVKFQVEFNPAAVAAWKLLGYEDRLLSAGAFNDDRKDGGELGAGHTVTVLYEVVPVGSDARPSDRPSIDPLKYQPSSSVDSGGPVESRAIGGSRVEWLTVKARYKTPEGTVSDLITQAVRPGGRVQHLPLASAIAEFGLLLRDHRGDTARWDALSRRVQTMRVPPSVSPEQDGFAELVEIARGLARLR